MKVIFYKNPSGRSPVQDFIEGLPKSEYADFYEVRRGVEKWGLAFSEVEFRQLQGKLWKIKFRTKGGRYRIAYMLVEAEVMVWLHIFKKTRQKTHSNDLKTAIKRMKEVINEI